MFRYIESSKLSNNKTVRQFLEGRRNFYSGCSWSFDKPRELAGSPKVLLEYTEKELANIE
jgi:hypothetical protein